MPRPIPEDGLTKFQRYRNTQRAKGMKLLRVWVPDPSSPGFRTEVRRQAALLLGAPEEADAIGFIEQAVHWPDS